MIALGMGVIGLGLLPEAHSATRQFAVGLELGLASVVLILGLLGTALRMWRRPRYAVGRRTARASSRRGERRGLRPYTLSCHFACLSPHRQGAARGVTRYPQSGH